MSRTVSRSPRAQAARSLPAPARPAVDASVRARFADADPDAVRAVYRAYGRLVYTVAYRLLGDRSLSEEATQQTFLKAWRAARSIDPSRNLGPWLAMIARRVAIDLYRREALRCADPLDEVAPEHPALVTMPASADTVFDIWEVRRAVRALPAEDQRVVRLQHFEGLTHAQIAKRLGLPLGTVKSRSFRAHKRLAAELGHLRTATRTGRRAEFPTRMSSADATANARRHHRQAPRPPNRGNPGHPIQR